MVEFIIIISLVIVALSWFVLSFKERNFFNILTPALITFVPSRYLFELSYIYYYGYSGSLFGYFFCYLVYALSIVFFVFTYLRFPGIHVKFPFSHTYRSHSLPYILIFIAIFLYLPILIEFREYLLSPREIYAMTRTGYGLNFFLSITCMYVAFIFFLFKKTLFKYEKLFAFIVCVIFALLHGSKGQIIYLMLIFVSYKVYINNVKLKFINSVLYVSPFVLVVLFLFSVTLYKVGDIGLIKSISSYSDYTRNAIRLIDSEIEPQYGRLTLEEAFYTRIPRTIYPDKPKDFGTFYLAKLFFPDWFAAGTGSPSFGIGVQYADFGIFSIFYHIIWAILSGILLKLFMVRLRIYKDPYDFIMVLFFTGINLMPLGVGYLLPEHFLLAYMLSTLSRLRLFPGNHATISREHK